MGSLFDTHLGDFEKAFRPCEPGTKITCVGYSIITRQLALSIPSGSSWTGLGVPNSSNLSGGRKKCSGCKGRVVEELHAFVCRISPFSSIGEDRQWPVYSVGILCRLKRNVKLTSDKIGRVSSISPISHLSPIKSRISRGEASSTEACGAICETMVERTQVLGSN